MQDEKIIIHLIDQKDEKHDPYLFCGSKSKIATWSLLEFLENKNYCKKCLDEYHKTTNVQASAEVNTNAMLDGRFEKVISDLWEETDPNFLAAMPKHAMSLMRMAIVRALRIERALKKESV